MAISPVDYQFLSQLLHCPAPSGYERPIQQIVREFASGFADDVKTDLHGNVIAAVNPQANVRVMLAGHCDQIGLMIKNIDDRGFLWVEAIGGWDVQMLIGQELEVHSANGPVPGVIARKAIHLLTADERKQVPEVKDLWIDIGATSRDEALELVALGDPVTLRLGFRDLRHDLIAGPGMDDRVGVWVVMQAAKRAAAKKPQAGVFAVSTVQEEIGLRGATTAAFSTEAQLGIAVDVTHATDCPGIDQNQYGKCELNKGPVVFRGPNINPVVFERLMSIAKAKNIPVQVQGLPRGASNDGNAMQLSRGGMGVGIIGIPNRYMHSPVEVVSQTDLDHAADLIAEFCLSVERLDDFIP